MLSLLFSKFCNVMFDRTEKKDFSYLKYFLSLFNLLWSTFLPLSNCTFVTYKVINRLVKFRTLSFKGITFFFSPTCVFIKSRDMLIHGKTLRWIECSFRFMDEDDYEYEI